MFLRRRPFRRLSVSSRYSTLTFTQTVPWAPYRHVSTSQQLSELPRHTTGLGAQRVSLTPSSDERFPRRHESLQALKNTEVLNVIQRTVETRNRLRFRAKSDPSSGYFRVAGAIYADAYLELRRRGCHSLMKTYPEVFVYIAEYCLAMDEPRALECVVKDITTLTRQLFESSTPPVELVLRFYRAVKNIFGHLVSHNEQAPPSTFPEEQHVHMIVLCETLMLAKHPSGVKLRLTTSDMSVLTNSIISLSREWGGLASFLDVFLRYIRDIPSEDLTVDQNEASSSVARARTELSLNFVRLIHHLLSKGLHRQSFSLLEALVEKGVVPPQAIRSSDSELDFRDFVISVLVRWSAHRGWSEQALHLLQEEDLTNPELQEHYTSLVEDSSMGLLVADTSKLKYYSQIIARALSQNPSIRLPNTLIHGFFKLAREAQAGNSAVNLYSALRSSSQMDHYIKGLLHGGVLPWLLGQILFESKDIVLGQRLAQDLINSQNPMKSHERGDFIALCAVGGYVAETRTLWERYAVGPEGRMVTGHTRCMVDIVKLFKTKGDITAKDFRDVNHGKADMEGTKETRSRDTVANNLRGYSSAARIYDAGTAGHVVKRQNFVGERVDSGFVATAVSSITGTSGIRDTSVGNNPIPEADDPESEGPATVKAIVDSRHDTNEAALVHADVELRYRDDESERVSRNPTVSGGPDADEDITFAHKVLDAYRRAKEPLWRASHYDLNALARASDILENVRQSMSALQVIIDRKEVPDARDLNVVIIAMAARDPLRAEEMLGLMLKEGMHLNALSFSAVVTGWLERGDTKHASRVFWRAMRAGHAQLTSDAAIPLLTALVDACCPSEGDPPGKARRDVWMHRIFLRQAGSLVDSEVRSGPTMSNDLGERCLAAALRLEEVGLAFFFWRKFFKRMGLRETDYQKALRHGTISLVKGATARGMIGADEGGKMMTELGNVVADP